MVGPSMDLIVVTLRDSIHVYGVLYLPWATYEDYPHPAHNMRFEHSPKHRCPLPEAWKELAADKAFSRHFAGLVEVGSPAAHRHPGMAPGAIGPRCRGSSNLNSASRCQSASWGSASQANPRPWHGQQMTMRSCDAWPRTFSANGCRFGCRRCT